MEFGALFVNQPALRGGRKAQLLAEGGFEGRHDLLLAAHDAVEPEVGAFDEGLAETFGDAGGIVGDHEKFGAFRSALSKLYISRRVDSMTLREILGSAADRSRG